MLEIDVKEPAKRSPITATADYGHPSANQYILQPIDGAQELPPEYLSVIQQYAQPQQQPQHQQPRREQPQYSKQQQELQQAYYNYRKPAVVPPRPRPQLHPQALADAEVTAEIRAQIDAQNRAEAIRNARLGSKSAYEQQAASYAQPKLGTFEQELLQLVSANQAQEFKLLPTQPRASSSAYSQQLVPVSSYQPQYAKQAAEPRLPEQYHIETSPPRYQQPQPQSQQQIVSYQSVEEQPVRYQTIQPEAVKAAAPQYDYIDEDAQYKAALEQAQARAQANAEQEALAFQKIAQAAYKKQQQDVLEHLRQTNERHRQQEQLQQQQQQLQQQQQQLQHQQQYLQHQQQLQQPQQPSALEQIQHGAQVSDAGRVHLQEQLNPKNAEAAYRAKVKAQIAAEAAEARKVQQAAEFKAHADAIKKLEAQQRAHIKVQEEVSNYALNFEKNQARAQAAAQAQAEALYKAQQQARNQVNKEILAITKGQVEGKKVDPDSPVYHYTLSTTTPLPLLNSYFTSEQLQKYQASGSSYVPRSVPKPDEEQQSARQAQQTQQAQSAIVESRPQNHKLKIPPQSLYLSGSGLLKKSPVKSLTIEEINVQPENPLLEKGRVLTEEDLSALINAGYTVTPVSPSPRPPPQTSYVDESAYYYAKKQKPVSRPEYIAYEEVIQRPRKLVGKRPILKNEERNGDASEKVTFLVPLEPAFGTRRPALKREE
ncbi:mediator of RNA polymerase II transcription subunit 15-like isoform X2 [Ceratina calcarata]|nr:mediator of RNA polymerase II transcription subunit 15-like isoform X2 [Ceratina calcarata]